VADTTAVRHPGAPALGGYPGGPGVSGFARRIPAVITTRAQLIDALSVAASIEHAILLQYLFTAWTLKNRSDEPLSPQLELTLRRWQQEMLRVSHEEMIHLGIITNLLNVVGAAPVLHRPNFPQAISPGSPYTMGLTRWDDHTLWRYVRMELPQGEPLPQEPPRGPRRLYSASDLTNPVEFDYLGELYDIIRAGFETLGAETLMVPEGVDRDTRWGLTVRPIPAVVDLPSALSALDLVVEQGEGAPENRADSHYERFRRLRRELADLPAGFDPARPVVDNPRTWADHGDSALPGTYLSNELTRRVATAANDGYRVLLLLMLQMFSYEPVPEQGPLMLRDRGLVKETAKQIMTSVLRPMAEVLNGLPAGDDPAQGMAGIPFEIYEEVRLPPRREPRVTIVTESLVSLERDCRELAAEAGVDRLSVVADHLGWIRRNLTDGALDAA